MKRIAFSQPTSTIAEQELLFTHFRSSGYNGLQLKADQYKAYVDQPARFVEAWGTDASDIASGLIAGGLLDETGIASLHVLFKFAHAVGSQRIIFCHAQPRQSVSSADIKRYAQILSELGKEAQQQGIQLSLHHHYNQPVMYRQDFETFFESISDQSVSLTIDTAHLIKSGIDDIAGIIRDYQQVLDNIHIKDFAAGSFKLLGQGEIDFLPVFSMLHEIGYTGWVCADEESGSSCLEAMEICAHFLRTRLDSSPD
ncbi:MAG TPA: TIM barrel protein [Ktedonobacteraceae bacterium]|jgi:sugar phosphate isomerase/epimerase|nr:TIM barrel protein [Ktedonobacteraceae bacterium]